MDMSSGMINLSLDNPVCPLNCNGSHCVGAGAAQAREMNSLGSVLLVVQQNRPAPGRRGLLGHPPRCQGTYSSNQMSKWPPGSCLPSLRSFLSTFTYYAHNTLNVNNSLRTRSMTGHGMLPERSATIARSSFLVVMPGSTRSPQGDSPGETRPRATCTTLTWMCRRRAETWLRARRGLLPTSMWILSTR